MLNTIRFPTSPFLSQLQVEETEESGHNRPGQSNSGVSQNNFQYLMAPV